MIDDDRFLLSCSGALNLVPKMWRRFSRIERDCYTSLYRDTIDALGFKARRPVYICGFIWTKEFHAKDFEILVRWRINDGESGEGEPTDWMDFSST